jgi:hypothetical protein
VPILALARILTTMLVATERPGDAAYSVPLRRVAAATKASVLIAEFDD